MLTLEIEEGIILFLLENKQAYLNKIAAFLFEEFNALILENTIYRALKRLKIITKAIFRAAVKRDDELRAI